MTVIADSTLDDYEAFRRGDRFYVKIPSAEFSAMQPSFHADGFDDVQVHKIGDSVVISFKLQPGASARVDGSANRLEVIFFSQNRMASINNADVNAVRNRVTRKTSGSGTSATRSTPKRGADIAGPMPPDSPREYRAGNVQDRPSSENVSPGAPSNIAATKRSEPALAGASSTPGVASSTPHSTSTPYAAGSQYSSTYPPVTSTTTPAVETRKSAGGVSWRVRIEAARQWFAMNKMASLIGGVVLLALLCFMTLVLYRRRRTAKGVRANTPRVQPKYSPDVQLEDMLTARASGVSAKVTSEPFLDEYTYENWGGDDEAIPERPSDVAHQSAASDFFNGARDEPWEVIGAAPDSQIYQGRVQEEREVFEL